jgi:hypothetical protein
MSTTSLHCHLLGTNNNFRVPVKMEQDNVYDLKVAIKNSVPQWLGDAAAPDIEVWAARIPPLANWAVDTCAANSLVQNTEQLQDGMPLSLITFMLCSDAAPHVRALVFHRVLQLTYYFYHTSPPPWAFTIPSTMATSECCYGFRLHAPLLDSTSLWGARHPAPNLHLFFPAASNQPSFVLPGQSLGQCHLEVSGLKRLSCLTDVIRPGDSS